jgi:hypothetical protein
MKGVSAGSSSKSKIYTEMSSGKMPESPRKMAISQIAIIKQWIDEGAKNITCGTIVIDAATPTFAKSIKPIIDTYCVGCHQTKSAKGSVILDSYAFIKNYIDNVRFSFETIFNILFNTKEEIQEDIVMASPPEAKKVKSNKKTTTSCALILEQ